MDQAAYDFQIGPIAAIGKPFDILLAAGPSSRKGSLRLIAQLRFRFERLDQS
jgi:hypothetical protein